MPLTEGKIGTVYLVKEVHCSEEIERRLAALGLNSGTHITLLNKKRKGAVILFVRGTRFAMGSAIAKGILVKEVDK